MRLLIADDHQFILESIEILIDTISDIEIVGTYSNGNEVLKALETLENIDIILTDNNMPELGGIELTYKVKEKYPDIKIVLLTVTEDATTIQAAFNAGVAGYVMKKAGRDELERAL